MRCFLLRGLVGFIFVSPTFASTTPPVKVLTHDSIVAEWGMGPYLKKEFQKKCSDCQVEFISTNDTASLWGRLLSDKRRGKKGADLVLGLDFHQYKGALKEKIVNEGRLFDRAPFAIIVDTKKIPAEKFPKNWADLPSQMKSSILVEDPRLSSAGLGWLRTIFEMKALSLKDSRAVTARVFPSWTSAYKSFENGEAPSVWSYVTSEAYHRCNAKSEEERTRYLALPLEEGYVVQEEWVAPIALSPRNKNTQAFVDFLLSNEVQEKIPTLNWMLPGIQNTKLPDCYKELTKVKSWVPSDALNPKNLSTWIDEWSL